MTEGNAAEWSHAPFGGDLVDGRIYGRGSADMKSGLAAAMIAAAAIKRSGRALGGRLVVGALVDEEGDMIGARHLCTTDARPRADARPSSASPSRTSCASSSAASCGPG